MTDETIAQIMEDAWAASMQQSGSSTPCYEKGYQAGATYQHSVAFEQGRKEGWNELINTLLRVNSNIIADLNEQLAIAVGDDEKKLAYWSSMETIKQYSEQLESLRNERA